MNKTQEHVLKEAELFMELFKIAHPELEVPKPQLLSQWFWLVYQDVNKLAAAY